MDVYIKNLPLTVEENDLMELFSPFNPVNALIIRNISTRISRGYGFIKLTSSLDVERAIDDLNGHSWRGHFLYLDKAKPLKSRKETGEEIIEEPCHTSYLKKYRGEASELGWHREQSFTKRDCNFHDPDPEHANKEIPIKLQKRTGYNKENTDDGFVKVRFKK